MTKPVPAMMQAVHHVQTLALFGSVARDEARPDSDVDLLVAFDRAAAARVTWRVVTAD